MEKMSKSKGNYIGITEPPKVIFRKVMGISDTLMWRYWELLTDKSMAEIAAMKNGRAHASEDAAGAANRRRFSFGAKRRIRRKRISTAKCARASSRPTWRPSSCRAMWEQLAEDLAGGGSGGFAHGRGAQDQGRRSGDRWREAYGSYDRDSARRRCHPRRQKVEADRARPHMERRHFVWKLAGRELLLGERTLLMGVLNVTPDSFSDGGKYLDPDRAFARAVELEEQGADIIDIGAESTKPGSQRISEAEELRRLVPVLKRLQRQAHSPDFRRHL